MYTLFGNDLAVQYAHNTTIPPAPCSLSSHGRNKRIPAGLVKTYRQRQSQVEFVTVGVTDNHKRVYSYQDYEGAPLKKISAQESPRLEGRTAYLLSQPAAVMP